MSQTLPSSDNASKKISIDSLLNGPSDSERAVQSWSNFEVPESISNTHPWIFRYYKSAILDGTAGSDLISTVDKEVYGDNQGPIAFRIGNGGAGYTGILKVLCERFTEQHGNDFRIAWVANHSRHTQQALLADIVQVALTYEPEMEDLAVREGWCRRVAAPAFYDHFMLVGPRSHEGQFGSLLPWGYVLQTLADSLADSQGLFHSRGDGSATHEREQKLWRDAGIDPEVETWFTVRAGTPYEALEMAAQEGAFLFTDRSTYLKAKKEGAIQDLQVYVEDKEELLNPCSALINTKVPSSAGQKLAIEFAEWLLGDDAQFIIRDYGKGWNHGMPLFTERTQEGYIMDRDRLVPVGL